MRSWQLFWGLLIIVIGVLVLGANFGWWPRIDLAELWKLWPLILIIIGLRRLISNDSLFSLLTVVIFLTALVLILAVDTLGVRRQAPWQPFSGRWTSQNIETTQFQTDVAAADISTLRIELGGPYDLKVNAADTDRVSVDVTGPKELVDRLALAPDGNRLVLRQSSSIDGWNFWQFRSVTGTVTLPRSMALDMDLSGMAKIAATGHQAPVTIEASGASDITFAGSLTTNPDIELSGAGKIVLDRCEGNGQLELSGAGKIEAADCDLQTLNIKTSGAGEVAIKAGSVTDLNLETSGASKVIVPKPSGKVDQDTSGASKIEFK